MLRRLHLRVAIGADQQQPLEPGVLGDELQQPQRRGIGPVQIVEYDHDRPTLRHRDQRGGDRVVQLKRLGRFHPIGRLGLIGRLGGSSSRARPSGSRLAAASPSTTARPRPASACADGPFLGSDARRSPRSTCTQGQ